MQLAIAGHVSATMCCLNAKIFTPDRKVKTSYRRTKLWVKGDQVSHTFQSRH